MFVSLAAVAYLVVEVLQSPTTGDSAGSISGDSVSGEFTTGESVVVLFVVQGVCQLVSLVHLYVFRPGRSSKLEVGDSVCVTKGIKNAARKKKAGNHERKQQREVEMSLLDGQREQPPAAPAMLAGPASQQEPRSKCEYGARCYRSGAGHRTECAHPGDTDWGAQPGPAAPLGRGSFCTSCGAQAAPIGTGAYCTGCGAQAAPLGRGFCTGCGAPRTAEAHCTSCGSQQGLPLVSSQVIATSPARQAESGAPSAPPQVHVASDAQAVQTAPVHEIIWQHQAAAVAFDESSTLDTRVLQHGLQKTFTCFKITEQQYTRVVNLRAENGDEHECSTQIFGGTTFETASVGQYGIHRGYPVRMLGLHCPVRGWVGRGQPAAGPSEGLCCVMERHGIETVVQCDAVHLMTSETIHDQSGAALTVTRNSDRGWAVVSLLLALLDWFHVTFNVANLFTITASGDDAFYDKNSEVKPLCYLCMAIYLVRMIAQPAVVFVRVCMGTRNQANLPKDEADGVSPATLAENEFSSIKKQMVHALDIW